jgi:thiol-disulfide isomerase/thioredoxin
LGWSSSVTSLALQKSRIEKFIKQQLDLQRALVMQGLDKCQISDDFEQVHFSFETDWCEVCRPAQHIPHLAQLAAVMLAR